MLSVLAEVRSQQRSGLIAFETCRYLLGVPLNFA
jgi:hypothetical protein